MKNRKGGSGNGQQAVHLASPLGIPTTMAELQTLQASGFPFQLVMVVMIVSFLMGIILF